MRCYFAEASGMEDVSVVTLSGQYESSCGYCGSEEGTSVAFGMTAKTMTVQARLLFRQPEFKDSWLIQSMERGSLLILSELISILMLALRCKESSMSSLNLSERRQSVQSIWVKELYCNRRSTRICWIEGGGGAALGSTFLSTTRHAVLATHTVWTF